jgi:hypothetical protein
MAWCPVVRPDQNAAVRMDMTDRRDVTDYDAHWNELEPLAAWGDAARSVIAQAAEDYRSIA